MDYRFDGSPLTETTVVSASDAAVLVAGGRHLSRAYDSSGRLWTLEAAWGQTLPGTASTAGSSTLSPQVVFSYGAADRLVSIYSGGFTGAVTRTATQESFSVSPNTGLYYPPSVNTAGGERHDGACQCDADFDSRCDADRDFPTRCSAMAGLAE